ncbi:MAG TPA: helicase-related protein [Bryobacteraceae bacterium]|nr:helicase-related protein [Bryobacteraceae bacterium]
MRAWHDGPEPWTRGEVGLVESGGDWFYDNSRRLRCRVLEHVGTWGQQAVRVWYPEAQTILLVDPSQLTPVEQLRTSPQEIAYVTAAAKVADALEENTLLAPIESSVIPLPHQILTLLKAVSSDRVRLLLADEVGLGKTIEAGLIIKELKLRGLVRRVLVVAPKGLVNQWAAEMRLHFGEQFRLLLPSDFPAFRRVAGHDNVWKMYDQIICPMDAVKPIENRRGWSKEQVAEHNRDRFEDLLAANWDLIVIDEAHRLGGTTDQVARFKLGQGLAEAAPYLLLLTATPHQGKSDAFHRLVSLLDKTAFPDPASVSRERLEPYLVRTEKRKAIDAQGNPLFKPRRTQLEPVRWNDRHALQRQLYEAISEYVRIGYNQAIREKKNYVGFLLILMQRLVTSSTRAIRTTLERRLEMLQAPEEQLSLFPPGFDEEWPDLDGQEQVEMLLRMRTKALRNERAEVQLLLDLARRTEATAADAKAEALLDWIYRLQQEETDPDLKILLFTEFVPTQEMLRDFLTERGFSVACLNGSMDMEARKQVLQEFAGDVRILISTDAGGEGLNLQFCHVVINYDIPWNPMRLEQRIGRVDRIGQAHVVRAVNFVLEDTVEFRVREVLEEKLAIILKEFGVDKTGDVLDSADAGEIFDELYRDAILDPTAVERKVDSVLAKIRAQAEAMRRSTSLLAQTAELSPSEAQRLLGHPLPYWVERMTVNYIQNSGGPAEKGKSGWRLHWPDGTVMPAAVFTLADAERHPAAVHLTLEEPRIRGIATRLSRFVPGQPIPCIGLKGLPWEIRGLWSLWTVAIRGAEWGKERILVLFVHDDGRILPPTARRIWAMLLEEVPEPARYLDGDEGNRTFAELTEIAESHGRSLYEELQRFHRKRLEREVENKRFSLETRRRAIERIGLPAVRQHRLNELAREEATWSREAEARAHVHPELIPRLVLRVEGLGDA